MTIEEQLAAWAKRREDARETARAVAEDARTLVAEALEAGLSQREIAAHMGISYQRVFQLAKEEE